MLIASVVGARPQFIKAVPISKVLRKKHQEILIHTGQHYDTKMSEIFFKELNLPYPKYHLGVGSGPPGWQVGSMLIQLEKILVEEKPELVIVYGDTHTTLAGALAAAKLNIPLAHVEAGLRSCNDIMQEEKNRMITDHLSKLLFCPTPNAVQNLEKEGIIKGVYLVGDVMVDTLKFFFPISENHSKILKKLNLSPKSYFLATIHRAENADNPARLASLLKGLSKLEKPVILPLHPRTRKQLKKTRLNDYRNIVILNPVGYLDMLALEKNAKLILTDSGGVQKEAYLLHVPCVTLREETEWNETVKVGCNALAGCNPNQIVETAKKLSSKHNLHFQDHLFGDGKTAYRIVKIIGENH